MAASLNWGVWGLKASVVVSDPDELGAAVNAVQSVVRSVDAACSRFRPDSELARCRPRLAAGIDASPLLALLVEQALLAAEWTGGDVDPTLGNELDALGYDRDTRSIDPLAEPLPTMRREGTGPGWKRVQLDGSFLRVPEDLQLDLGATAKAVAADLAVQAVAAASATGVMVVLGGDLATGGPAPGGGWQVLVQDTAEDPAQQVTLASGSAMATSSTQHRRWRHGGTEVHHILDPRFGLPAKTVWRSVSVAHRSCLRANALSTAAIVRGYPAVGWLESGGVAARFVDRRGNVITTGDWPAMAYEPAREVQLNG
jgi:FAD:protein FMN transferase